jgi:uncharacterized membrane protein
VVLEDGDPLNAAADSVQHVDMQVDDLMKICFSIGVMSSKVIPHQYVVPLNELEPAQDRRVNTIKGE